MPYSTYCLAPDVHVSIQADALLLLAPDRLLEPPFRIPPAFVSAVRQLVESYLDRSQMEAAFLDCAGDQPAAAYFLLNGLDRGRFLSERLYSGDRLLVEFCPSLPFDRPSNTVGEAIGLSRFAFLRATESGLVLESAATSRIARIEDATLLSLIHRLARGDKPGPFSNEPTTGSVVDALSAAGFVVDLDASGESREDREPLATWEFHDLLFHTRSRSGTHRNRSGSTFRFKGRLPALPFDDPRSDELGIGLELAVPEHGVGDQESLTSVLERRRSVRSYGKTPISVDQIAELLYRAARVLTIHHDPETGDVVQRPFPSGGGIHELVIYPLINRCTGLERGVYRYDAATHKLIRTRSSSADIDALLRGSAMAMAMTERAQEIQVVLLVASRFPRLAWKYESMAYALTLKNLGSLYQTLYLVAIAMGIAPCAIGYGDADLFARATGTDPLVEPLIGEFVIGSAGGEPDGLGGRGNATG